MKEGTEKQKEEYRKVAEWTYKWAKTNYVKNEGFCYTSVTSNGIDESIMTLAFNGQSDLSVKLSGLASMANKLFASDFHRRWILTKD